MLIGALLTALGIVALVMGGGIQYTSSEKLPRDSKTQVTAHMEKVISIPPLVGGLVLAGGIVLMIVAARE
jgi:hypothetical protein